jgi:hypothetical protein
VLRIKHVQPTYNLPTYFLQLRVSFIRIGFSSASMATSNSSPFAPKRTSPRAGRLIFVNSLLLLTVPYYWTSPTPGLDRTDILQESNQSCREPPINNTDIPTLTPILSTQIVDVKLLINYCRLESENYQGCPNFVYWNAMGGSYVECRKNCTGGSYRHMGVAVPRGNAVYCT